MARSQIIFTLGDPLSVNCEGLFTILETSKITQYCPVVVIGSRWQIEHQSKVLSKNLPLYQTLTELDQPLNPGFYSFDPSPIIGREPPENLSEEIRGQMMVSYLNAIPKNMQMPFAVLTGPIDKHVASLGEFKFPGQTEFFEHHWQGEALMLLAGPKLRVGLATNHLPLKDVPKAMTQPLILRKLAIFAEGLRNIYGITHPKIAVCGLNPHCGDRGLFGSEEIEIIRPAIEAFQNNFAWTTVSGPLPADTVFHSAAQGLFDGVLAMYHDQGLGPLKTIHFDTAVNVSVGLRNLRVSPDHGPAASLYGKGTASMKSFTAAFDLCEKWLEQHGANS